MYNKWVEDICFKNSDRINDRLGRIGNCLPPCKVNNAHIPSVWLPLDLTLE